MMRHRWTILVLVALSVAALDQWTKYLAVRHLTPAFAPGGAAAPGPGEAAIVPEKPATDLKAAGLARLTVWEKTVRFYRHVEHPCRGAWGACPTVAVVPGFWNWRYVENPGAAFGFLVNAPEAFRRPFFMIISLLALVFIIGYFRKPEAARPMIIWALSLISGGALGNAIDRIHLSYVIDFIDWYVGTRHWPTFNVADAAITTGVGLVLLEQLLDWRRSKRAAPAPDAKQSAAEAPPPAA